MNELINELLEDSIEDCLLKLKQETDSEEREHMIHDIQYLSKIHNDRLDIYNRSNEVAFKEEDIEIKRRCIRQEKIFNGLRVGVDIMGIVLPIMFYSTWMKTGLKFEETGTLISPTFKGLIGKFKPTK